MLIKVEGQVYCTEHTVVHEDSLDPYDEGYDSCLQHVGRNEKRRKSVHRTLYWRTRKGDLETFSPADVSIPVNELDAGVYKAP